MVLTACGWTMTVLEPRVRNVRSREERSKYRRLSDDTKTETMTLKFS